MFYVYVLRSKLGKKTYVGHTSNIKRRLREHNNGESLFTNRYKPWVLLYSEGFRSLTEALKREKYLKSAAGRRWMKKHLFVNQLGLNRTDPPRLDQLRQLS